MKLALILFLVTVSSFGGSRTFELSSGSFDLESKSGSIKISGEKSSKIKVSFTKVKWDKSCTISFKHKVDELDVEVKDSSFFGNSDCEVNFEIYLPSNIEVDIESGAGDITASNLSNKLDIESGSGNVSINESKLNKLDIEIGSGSLKYSGEAIETEVEIGSGDISIGYTKVLPNSKYESSQGSGSSSLKLPKGTTTNVKFNTGSGELKNSTTHSVSAHLNVKVTIGTGSLEIH